MPLCYGTVPKRTQFFPTCQKKNQDLLFKKEVQENLEVLKYFILSLIICHIYYMSFLTAPVTGVLPHD